MVLPPGTAARPFAATRPWWISPPSRAALGVRPS